VVAGREGLFLGKAVAPSHHAERPFGHDVDVIRAACLDQPPDATRRRQRQPDVGICGHRQRAKEQRRQEHYLHAKGFQRFGKPLKRVDDAIDLWAPSVRHHQDAPRAVPRLSGKAFAALFGQVSRSVDSVQTHAAFQHRFMTGA
jgi:hypothetical protein